MRYRHVLECNNCFMNHCEVSFECDKMLSVEELKMFSCEVCCRKASSEKARWKISKVKVLWWKR